MVVVGRSAWPVPLTASGSYEYAAAVAHRLGGRYDVVVPAAGSEDPRRECAGPVVVHRAHGRTGITSAVSTLFTVRSLLRDARASAVLVSSDPFGVLVCELARRGTDRPHVFQVQGEVVRPGPEYGSRWRRWVLARVVQFGLRRATAVRAVSGSIAAQASEITRRPVQVVSTRVDVSQFHPAQAMEQPGGAVVVASLIPGKMVDTVLRAWARLPPLLQAQGLDVVGGGVEELALRALTDRLGLGACVHFHGRLPHAEVAQVLRRRLVLLLASRSEGRPRVVLEACASGLPVVLSDIAAHRELAELAGEAATLAPIGDVSAWSAAISNVLTLPTGEWRRRSERARRTAEEHFDFDENADAFAQLVRYAAGMVPQ